MLKQGLKPGNCQGNEFLLGLMRGELDSWYQVEVGEVANFCRPHEGGIPPPFLHNPRPSSHISSLVFYKGAAASQSVSFRNGLALKQNLIGSKFCNATYLSL